jgi:2-(1,2-epoxy-1,2-dihydrophenyl)acetyl-CoA isomerase
MTYSTIRWEATSGVGTLTFDRPDRLNGITNVMARELHEALTAIAADESVAVVILTGAGKAFCPGADLRHYSSGEADEPLKMETFDVPLLLHEMPQVTIAAINGACAGAGLGYACACDLRYAARDARINTAFLDVAVAGDMGLPWTLPRIVGAGRARELSLLPRKLIADEAFALGLVNDTFERDSLMDEVRSRAERIAASAPLARRGMKSHYTAAERLGFAEFIRLESEDHMRIMSSTDTREAFAAFVEKRTATFTGR